MFTLPEVKLLMDAVESSKFITARKSSELADKLSQMTSVYQSEELKRNIYISKRVKPMNEQIYYLLDNINRQSTKANKSHFCIFTITNIVRKFLMTTVRRGVIRELIQAGAEDETIKSIIRPELTEAEVQEKKKAWMEMQNI